MDKIQLLMIAYYVGGGGRNEMLLMRLDEF